MAEYAYSSGHYYYRSQLGWYVTITAVSCHWAGGVWAECAVRGWGCVCSASVQPKKLQPPIPVGGGGGGGGGVGGGVAAWGAVVGVVGSGEWQWQEEIAVCGSGAVARRA